MLSTILVISIRFDGKTKITAAFSWLKLRGSSSN
uniref:Uncharacterized protein n=1 Tax=Arundo donax TaxID=35708 RepID=A0A0A8YNR8_ARUDO